MTPGERGSDRAVGWRGVGRCLSARRVRACQAAVLLAAIALFPSGVRGLPAPGTSQECSALPDRAARQAAHPCTEAGLIEVRILEGRLAEAELLAAQLVVTSPGWSHAWELLAVARYLQDDSHGALLAWNQAHRPRVHDLEIGVLGRRGARVSESGPDPDQVSGIAPGEVLTVASLVRGERRLGALPAADRSRLGYRMLPGGEATVDGTVVLGEGNPFTRPELVVHALRLVGRRVHLVSADPLGRMERWEAFGTVEGTLRRAGVALAHPAPVGHGVWRWGLDHEIGRYGSAGLTDSVRETSTSLGWSHTDWITSTLRGSVHGRVDMRPERGTFVGAGAAWTLLPQTARAALGAEGTGWVRVGGDAPDGSAKGPETRYGRAEVRGVFRATRPREPRVRPGGNGPWIGLDRGGLGVDIHGGFLAVSRGTPPGLMPRMGSGGNAALLMRARSDLDGQGVVRPAFPGTAWAHGGVEVQRPVAAVGPLGLGVALFADGVRVLAPKRTSNGAVRRLGAVHLGGGVRARIPWVDGWLRADWGIDPSDGTSTFSAAWVREHRLLRLSAH